MKSSQPMSSWATSRLPSSTSIWVFGVGNPASIKSSRNQVSFGEAAPPSTSGSASRGRRRPLAPRWRLASCSTSSIENAITRINASSRATASSRGRWRPRSNAVRARVVTGRPATRVISSSASDSLRTNNPRCALALGAINSIGMPASTHAAPCSADAATPATTARRRDHSQAPIVRSRSEGSVRFGMYTSRKIGLYQRRNWYSVSLAVAIASLPMNTSPMA